MHRSNRLYPFRPYHLWCHGGHMAMTPVPGLSWPSCGGQRRRNLAYPEDLSTLWRVTRRGIGNKKHRFLALFYSSSSFFALFSRSFSAPSLFSPCSGSDPTFTLPTLLSAYAISPSCIHCLSPGTVQPLVGSQQNECCSEITSTRKPSPAVLDVVANIRAKIYAIYCKLGRSPISVISS